MKACDRHSLTSGSAMLPEAFLLESKWEPFSMAIDSNAYSLADYALNSNSPMVRAITYSLIESGNVLQDMPILRQAPMIANGVGFEAKLPTANSSQLTPKHFPPPAPPPPSPAQYY